jgi:PAS domain S-box-containing protein
LSWSDRFPRHLHTVIGVWQALRSWVQGTTIVPQWLPERWRHPLIGYLAALGISIGAAGITLLLSILFPTLALKGFLLILGIVAVALTWGAGPSLLAVVVSAWLVWFVVVPPHFFWQLNQPGAWVDGGLHLISWMGVGLLASQSGWARRQAEALAGRLRQAEREAATRAREVEAIFEALTDGLLVYDAQGSILRCNTAARQLLGFESHPELVSLPWKERATRYTSLDAAGQPIPTERLALSRLLRGEVLTGTQIAEDRLHTPNGREIWFSMTGRPLHDAKGTVIGAVGIARDVTEQRRLEQQTQAQMETFLGVASHELKNPLTSIKLALQLIERRISLLAQNKADTAHDVTPLLNQIARAGHQATRLERLVNDLVDISRVRAGKLDLHLEPTDLATIVHETVEEQRQANPARALVFAFPAGVRVPVWADADRLGQVVTNYLTNALKYSPADCPVEVGLDMEQQQARVWVRDEGPGLPREEQERIWDRFYRAKGIEVQSGTGVGLGLGLHICRTIVERHQGQVGIQSVQGQGSTFWFTVPLGHQPGALAP